MVQAVARDALHAEPAHVILRELGHFRRESNSQAPQLASQGSQPHAGEGLCQTCPCTKSHATCTSRREVLKLVVAARRESAARKRNATSVGKPASTSSWPVVSLTSAKTLTSPECMATPSDFNRLNSQPVGVAAAENACVVQRKPKQ